MDQLEMARKGGLAIKKKFGKGYFKKLRAKRTVYKKRTIGRNKNCA